MPIIKSAIKRAKQSLVRRSRNLQVKRAVKADVTALHNALAAGEPKLIETSLSEAYSEIDRAVKKHTIHKNTAARRKSQLAHAVAKSSGTEATPVEAKTTKGAGKGKKTTAAKSTAKKAPASKPVAAKKPAAKKPAAKASAPKAAPKAAAKAEKPAKTEK